MRHLSLFISLPTLQTVGGIDRWFVVDITDQQKPNRPLFVGTHADAEAKATELNARAQEAYRNSALDDVIASIKDYDFAQHQIVR